MYSMYKEYTRNKNNVERNAFNITTINFERTINFHDEKVRHAHCSGLLCMTKYFVIPS